MSNEIHIEKNPSYTKHQRVKRRLLHYNVNDCYWNNIPNEVAIQIFEFACFRSAKQWYLVNVTCKRWRELTAIHIFFYSCILYKDYILPYQDNDSTLFDFYKTARVQRRSKHMNQLWNTLKANQSLSPDKVSPCETRNITYADYYFYNPENGPTYTMNDLDENTFVNIVSPDRGMVDKYARNGLCSRDFNVNTKILLESIGCSSQYFLHYISGGMCINFSPIGGTAYCSLCARASAIGTMEIQLFVHVSNTLASLPGQINGFKLRYSIDIENRRTLICEWSHDDLMVGNSMWFGLLRFRFFMRMHGIECTLEVGDTEDNKRYAKLRLPEAKKTKEIINFIRKKMIFLKGMKQKDLLQSFLITHRGYDPINLLYQFTQPVTPKGWINRIIYNETMGMNNIICSIIYLLITKDELLKQSLLDSIPPIVRNEVILYENNMGKTYCTGDTQEDRITHQENIVKRKIDTIIQRYKLEEIYSYLSTITF